MNLDQCEQAHPSYPNSVCKREEIQKRAYQFISVSCTATRQFPQHLHNNIPYKLTTDVHMNKRKKKKPKNGKKNKNEGNLVGPLCSNT